jgi:hypothetical protein
MDGAPRAQDPESMKLDPRRSRRERRERELADLEVFRTVRRVADQELREMASVAPSSHEIAAARAALEAATTAEEVVALEPLVRKAGSHVGVDVPEDRTVRIADRSVPWSEVGGSYEGVAAAVRSAQFGSTPDQRNVDIIQAKWKDQERPRI